jgi:carbamoyltransferase
MNYIGISSGFHDASVTVLKDGQILFAGHSERYSKIKNDKNLDVDLIKDALSYIDGPHELHYYEKPWLKVLRQWYAGQKTHWSNIFTSNVIGKSYHEMLGKKTIHTHSHHLSHAAAGFQTSPFNEATIVVIDAIGEFDTVTIWSAHYDYNHNAVYKKLYTKRYPNSIGLFYSAVTKRVGLRPNDEEYITMGMSAYGSPVVISELCSEVFDDLNELKFRKNLHIGFDEDFLPNAKDEDIARSAQDIVEHSIMNIMQKARTLSESNNLVYAGGVALNCLANRLIGKYFSNLWIMPNPGDAGSSLGAACLGYRKKVEFNSAFLGHEIQGEYPVHNILQGLLTDKIVGVASGKAEFGPRAFGNRSLLADPRSKDIKDQVNEIKRRQKFRPFAPVILEEHAPNYFIMPLNWKNSRYMQVVAKCKNPERFPAIVHVDGTSRVQTVPKDGSGIRKLLEEWHKKTGCPMLLNTSLNIRGEPMVNDRADADRFEQLYNVKVYS